MTFDMMSCCSLCPRECHADRVSGEAGFCGAPSEIKAARASLHMWEEPCISGSRGSGTVFFTGCSLGCVYCQNHEISRRGKGTVITPSRLCAIFLELQDRGAHNINLVTGTQYAPQIVKALERAGQLGLNIPVVWNSSGYEKVSTLRMLEGLVDIYLPDLKYFEARTAQAYSHAPDYFRTACAAIEEMIRQRGLPEFDSEGMLRSGVMVRHLLLPGHVREAEEIIRYLADHWKEKVLVSLMSQYTPMPSVKNDPLLSRKITKREYSRLLSFALECGIENGYMQEGDPASESFIPLFDGCGL